MGNLGFLATFSPQEALDKFVPLLKGGYKIENRNLLQCECPGSKPAVALNDIVIKGEDASRLVSLAVRADGELVSEYFCDGLIFSSPTGSTAYNLSAGGPLVHPKADVVAMTPICPHTLSNRSVVFPDTTRLEVTWDQSAAHPQVKIDGYLTLRPSGDGKTPIAITPAQKKLSLLQSEGHSHFSVVRNKLNWR
jgi:NAD+ kinase